MKELVVLGFASRELAEEARSRGAELDREGVLQLDGAALAYRRDDGRVELVQPMRLAPVGAASGAAAGGVLGLLLLEPCCSPPSAPSPEPPARGCPRSGSTSGSSASSTRPSSPAVRHCSSSSATPTPSGRSRRSARSPPGCCAPPCPPTPSGASSPPSPTPLPRRARRRPPHQLQTDRPGGAGLLWSKARSWRSGEGSPAGRPQVGRQAAEQPHQVGDRDIQLPGAARPQSPSS
jgi:hypothetical protein